MEQGSGVYKKKRESHTVERPTTFCWIGTTFLSLVSSKLWFRQKTPKNVRSVEADSPFCTFQILLVRFIKGLPLLTGGATPPSSSSPRTRQKSVSTRGAAAVAALAMAAVAAVICTAQPQLKGGQWTVWPVLYMPKICWSVLDNKKRVRKRVRGKERVERRRIKCEER